MATSRLLPRVVAIIPFYNGSEFIERALRSVFAQTIAFEEVIVVNDGSAPDERKVLGLMAETYAFKILDKDNGGQGSARNLGVAESSADLICFLDQDDFFLETHVETLLNAMPEKDPRFGFVYGDVFEADGAGQIIQMATIKDFARDHPKRSVFNMIASDMFVLPSAALISRQAFEAIKGFDEQFMGYEDDDLFLRIFRAGYTNYFVDKAVTAWCIHTASTSFGIRMSRSRFKYFTKLSSMFPDEPLRGHFYMRDYLAPRFGPFFINDVIKARSRARTEDLAEVMGILDAYGTILKNNSYVSSLTKFGFWLTSGLLKSTPDFLLKGIFIAVDGRILKRIRKWFH